MKKQRYSAKTKEEAIKNATIDLQELEENLIVIEKESKQGLFSKKVEIEVIEKRDVVDFIKNYLKGLIKDLGMNADIEVRNSNEVPVYRIYSDHDALLIGKNGKNLKALSIITANVVKKEVGVPFKFLLDVSDYKEKRERQLVRLARFLAREVKQTKVEVKMDSMNSYERRIVHNALTNNKYVYTESTGEEPNRAVVIKPKEEK